MCMMEEGTAKLGSIFVLKFVRPLVKGAVEDLLIFVSEFVEKC